MSSPVERAWESAVEFVTYKPESREETSTENLSQVFNILEEHKLLNVLVMWHLNNFNVDLDERILSEFKEKLIHKSNDLPESIEYLNDNIKWYFFILSKLTSMQNYQQIMQGHFKAAIYELLQSKKVLSIFTKYYSKSFRAFIENYGGDPNMAPVMKIDEEVVNVLDLGLFGVFFIKPVTIALQSEIKMQVEEYCKGKYEESWMNGVLEHWMNFQVMPWVKNVLDTQNSTTSWFTCSEMASLVEIDASSLNHWRSKVKNIVYETYTHMRIEEMFNIITDFPESSPAIKDLKLCLEHTNQRPYLIDALKKDLPKRVLHPGVCTSDIITLYIPAVKVLRMLDPTGVVMEIVLEPCTKYLKMRDDAVKMIMTGLLNDENGINELASELERGATDQEHNAMMIGDSNEMVEKLPQRPEDWKPDPREADPDKSDKFRRTSDIISLLVGMYGSKERFITEYQKLLSQRLLSTWFTETSENSEIKNLELLKLRFGEDNLVKCAVMLKDVADSRRINSYVKDEYMKSVTEKPPVDISTMIVSSECWPDIQPHDLSLPLEVQKSLDVFRMGYEGHKASRSLKWLSNIGKVDLELELENRTLTFNHITPLLASIIYLFQDKTTWTLSEISNELKVPTTMIRRKISYWLQEGVLKESSQDVYVISESTGAGYSGKNRSLIRHEDDEEDSDENTESKKEKGEQVLWNYIKGMLMNFESLPVDKIHKMMCMFAIQDTSLLMEQSKLNILLQKKVHEGVLTFVQGHYKIIK